MHRINMLIISVATGLFTISAYARRDPVKRIQSGLSTSTKNVAIDYEAINRANAELIERFEKGLPSPEIIKQHWDVVERMLPGEENKRLIAEYVAEWRRIAPMIGNRGTTIESRKALVDALESMPIVQRVKPLVPHWECFAAGWGDEKVWELVEPEPKAISTRPLRRRTLTETAIPPSGQSEHKRPEPDEYFPLPTDETEVHLFFLRTFSELKPETVVCFIYKASPLTPAMRIGFTGIEDMEMISEIENPNASFGYEQRVKRFRKMYATDEAHPTIPGYRRMHYVVVED